MIRPTGDELLFSAKSYLGAMLALYLSYRIGLSRPFWALTTAYIVSQPWSGAVRSKAVYRLLGTFSGSAVCVFLVPQLANAPVLLALAMMGWIGLCVYVSVLDRTPRSYMFMLAGITAAMVAFPSVSTPETVFDTALARVEEISLGIVCATLVHSLIFPRGIGTLVTSGLDRAMRDAKRWIRDVLGGASVPERRREQLALASDITQLRLLSTHVPYDTSNLRFAAGAVHTLQDTLAAMTPVIAAVEDRLQALAAQDIALPPAWTQVLSTIDDWMNPELGDAQSPSAVQRAASIHADIDSALPDLHRATSWRDALFTSLAVRLHELVDLHARALTLRTAIDSGLQGNIRTMAAHTPHHGPLATATREAYAQALHHDHGVALLSAAAAAGAVGLVSAFWIATAWPQGAVAVLMAAIFSSFFAAQDNPVPGIMVFLRFTIYSMPLSALYLLGIMPAVHHFETLALAILPVALILGVVIARPATMGQGMALFFGFAGTLALHDTQTADLVTFLDTYSAQIVGVAVAAIVATLFRKMSAATSARRIQASSWRELAQLATARRAPNAYLLNARRLDRVGLLQAKLGAADASGEVAAAALLDLRIGRDMVDLLGSRDTLPGARVALRDVLVDLARLARHRARHSDSPLPTWPLGDDSPSPLLARIDTALAQVLAEPADARVQRRAVVALVGLRRALFGNAFDYAAADHAAAAKSKEPQA